MAEAVVVVMMAGSRLSTPELGGAQWTQRQKKSQSSVYRKSKGKMTVDEKGKLNQSQSSSSLVCT